jgi:ABC-2 type transport system ATP-binding protein
MVGLVPEREAVPGYLTGRQFVRSNAELQSVADVVAATETAIATVDMAERRTARSAPTRRACASA